MNNDFEMPLETFYFFLEALCAEYQNIWMKIKMQYLTNYISFSYITTFICMIIHRS